MATDKEWKQRQQEYEYWKNRQKQLNTKLTEKETDLKKRLNDYYQTEQVQLKQLVSYYYQEYGKENVLEYRTMLEGLSVPDRELLFKNINDFMIKYPEYAHLAPTATSIYELNRLEGLAESVKMMSLEQGAFEDKEITKHLEDVASMGVRSITDFTGSFNKENSAIIKAVVNKDWTGQGSYSDAIWKNKEKLVEYVKTDFTNGLIRGDNYATMTKLLTTRMSDVSKNDAYRLIFTEGTHVLNESQAEVLEDDFEYYSIVTAGDDSVCEICQAMEDESTMDPIPFSDRVEGDNFPPFHPWCRCTYSVVIPKRNSKIKLNDDQKKEVQDLLDEGDDE